MFLDVRRLDNAEIFDAAACASLGTPMEFRCRLRLRARNTMVVFEQWLLDKRLGVPLAKADITCLCLNAENNKMVAAPERLLKQLEKWQQ